MKATGIVRRIDDLGRVVIPKEIRRTLRIREGDPLEIFTDKEGGVIFRKYSQLGDVSDVAGHICEAMSRNTGLVAAITDRDSIIAVSGAPRREVAEKQISHELESLMEQRKTYQAGKGISIHLCADSDKYSVCAAVPILSEGDILGSVVLANTGEIRVEQSDLSLTQTIAVFLGRHMET